MLLSLLSGGITLLNAAGFLLMAAGPALLDFIVVSSIFSVASWLYSWALPAAVAYRSEALPLLRQLQLAVVAGASLLILVSHPTAIGIVFIAMMIVDVIVFPAYIILFRSETRLFLRLELVRGVANSLALLAVIALVGRSPLAYAVLLLVNVVASDAALAITGVHRPPSLAVAGGKPLTALRRRGFWTLQLQALLGARGLETAALLGFGHFGALSPVLSLKIGLALSSTLAVNARAHRLATMLAAHLGIYAVGTAAIILAVASRRLPLPPTLTLIDPWNAVLVLPIVLASFTLSIIGLRRHDGAANAASATPCRP